MKSKEKKWLNIIALVLLYAITAVVACLLVHICNKYMFEIAENIRMCVYIVIGILALGLLIFRCVKVSLTKLAKFEWVIAIIFVIIVLHVLAVGLLRVIVKYGIDSENMSEYFIWCYLLLVVFAPVILMLLSKFVRAKALLAIAIGAFFIYAFAITTIGMLTYIDFLADIQLITSILLISVPLFYVLYFMSLRLTKSKTEPDDVAHFDNKRGLLRFILVIAFLIISFISANDDWVSMIISGLIQLSFIPCVLYFVIIKIADFKYRREEEENLSEKIVVAE